MWLADPFGAARPGEQRRWPRRRRDPPACDWRRVLGGFGGRPFGRAQPVRSCLDSPLAWLVFGCWTVCPENSCWWRPRRRRPCRWRPCCLGRVAAGGCVGGQVGRQVAMQCVVDILLLLWWQMCAASGRRGSACKLACMFVRTLLAASDV